MGEHEVSEAPEPETPAVSSEPEPEPQRPAPEPEAPVVSSDPEPETPPSEENGSVDGDKVQDLIDAIGDLNQTITDAVTGDPEPLPPDEGDIPYDVPFEWDFFAATNGADYEEVVELLQQDAEMQATLHNDLLQLQANTNFLFSAVVALIGVMLGAAAARAFGYLWRS